MDTLIRGNAMPQKKSQKKHKPPSYYRYQKAHPSITVALTEVLKTALDLYRGGLSYGEAIKKLITDKLKSYTKGWDDGHKAGWEGGYEEGHKDAWEEARDKYFS